MILTVVSATSGILLRSPDDEVSAGTVRGAESEHVAGHGHEVAECQFLRFNVSPEIPNPGPPSGAKA